MWTQIDKHCRPKESKENLRDLLKMHFSREIHLLGTKVRNVVKLGPILSNFVQKPNISSIKGKIELKHSGHNSDLTPRIYKGRIDGDSYYTM